MYTLGIPNRQYRRTTQVLGSENADPIDYEAVDQGDGFYLFSFPEADEFEFREIVEILNANGITTIGDDEALTERKIMKLVDLLNEQGLGNPYNSRYPDGIENSEESSLMQRLKQTLESWRKPTYKGGGALLDSCERSAQYDLDLEDIIEEFTNTEFQSVDRSGQMSDEEADDLITKGDINEQKLRKIIRKMIRE